NTIFLFKYISLNIGICSYYCNLPMNTSVLIMDKVVFILLILPLAIHSCTPSMEDTTDYDAIKTELMQDSALAGKEKRIEAAVEFYNAEIQTQFSHRIKLTTDSRD